MKVCHRHTDKMRTRGIGRIFNIVGFATRTTACSSKIQPYGNRRIDNEIVPRNVSRGTQIYSNALTRTATSCPEKCRVVVEGVGVYTGILGRGMENNSCFRIPHTSDSIVKDIVVNLVASRATPINEQVTENIRPILIVSIVVESIVANRR